MSQVSLGKFPMVPGTTDGSALVEIVNEFYAAYISSNMGPVEPPDAQTGTLWLDNALVDFWYLKILTGSGWGNILTVEVATGIITLDYTAPVTRVNGEVGDISVRTLFNLNGATPTVIPYTTGALVTFPDVAELTVPTLGLIGKDTSPYLKNWNGVAWDKLGNMASLATDLAIVGTEVPLSTDLETNQIYFLNTATPVTLNLTPFGVINLPKPGSRITLIGSEGTAPVKLFHNGAAYGAVLRSASFDLVSNGVIEFIVSYDNKFIEIVRGG